MPDSVISNVSAGVLDLLFPAHVHCAACDAEAMLLPGRAVCFDCEENMPYDTRLDIPFETPMPFERAAAALHYEQGARRMVHAFKYRDHRYLKDTLAYYLVQKLRELNWHFDAIVPVPLHKDRLKQRGYNQSELLAKCLGARCGKDVLSHVLERVRDTHAQMELGRKQRLTNLTGAFEAVDASDAAGKILLLVDDVLTTGSTVRECAQTLLNAGARGVCVICFATGE